MKNFILPTLLSACSISLLSACSTTAVTPQIDTAVAEHNIVASVNGHAITENAIKSLETETAIYNKRIKVSREQLLTELINRELLSQQAVKHQLDKKPETVNRIATAKRSILFQVEMHDFMQKSKITHAELLAEYKRQTESSTADFSEYKARHILTSSKEQAIKIIALLNKGQNFTALAKKFSTDASAEKGGDLGWFNGKQMVPAFSAAIHALKNGEYSQQPVNTGHGWHIILREESRQKQPPALASVHQSLENHLKRIKFQQYLDQLKKDAVIIQKTVPADTKK